MKHLSILVAAACFALWSCDQKPPKETLTQAQTDSIAALTATQSSVDTASKPAPMEKKIIPPNSKVVDSLLKKPVTTPANNPFGLKPGDNLLTSGALNKEPLKMRMQIILGDKFDEYKKFLTTAKALKKDSDGFLYAEGAAAKGSKNKAFFLYQHEQDVLFVGYQKGEERLMLNDMKSRMFAPESVDMWAERPIEY
ncbi:hypothetical protein [Cytophaga hutchinsonii]|jgi:hypothetical protein|uniref:Uncharacterized protein n=1 Tax=Cytophaga hutchinsonii (strain ATCC 33406 / DSM 1761 / CIP 103989 / NBRC 15051 / NCIMB 9469 / D465) TaxID=269798 RepID=A0A6N4SNI9_CYTH3|nr:hypothetical protein [Cytophaga hutchinsonii]ABG57862.1 hypothetical protein CHU_0575 [Cytophaga hutchinsonii ATCC 33406]SFX07630.1 hypothetical protein SAMN04487930_101416 [Cytophaga hutchinsonii ATCC 33406]